MRKKNWTLSICFFVGLFLFLLIYGVRPLCVGYDGWVLNGYVETDITQYYSGWIAYRNAKKVLPFTFSEYINYPFGDFTSLCDNTPIARLAFKVLSPVLPATFQYFGLLCCMNMCLQAVFAGKIFSLFSDDQFLIITGSTLMCFSPIMLERMFRHTSLSFHWLILAAIYMYIDYKNNIKITNIKFILLSVLTVWVHLYFTPIVLGFFLAAVLDDFRRKRKIKPANIIFFTVGLFLCLLNGKMLGIFNIGIDNTTGYGQMGLNLNSLFNPKSLGPDWWVPGKGMIIWSKFLPPRAYRLNNIESFNYLGLGNLLLFAAFLIDLVIKLVKKDSATVQKVKNVRKNNLFLILFLIFTTFFAISNNVCAFSHVLFSIPLHEKLLKVFSAFRASGRMFYAVSYVIVLSSAVYIFGLFKNKTRKRLLLAFILTLQILDLSPALKIKHQDFSKCEEYRDLQTVQTIVSKANENTAIVFLEPVSDRALCAELLKSKIKNNVMLISRQDYGIKKQKEFMEQRKENLIKGISIPGEIYATKNEDTKEKIVSTGVFKREKVENIFIIEYSGNHENS